MIDKLLTDAIELVFALLIIVFFVWKPFSSNREAQQQQERRQPAGQASEERPNQPSGSRTMTTGFRLLRTVAAEVPAGFAHDAHQKHVAASEPGRPAGKSAETGFAARKTITNEDAPCFVHGVPQRECKGRH